MSDHHDDVALGDWTTDTATGAGAARLRPSISTRTLPAITSLAASGHRQASNVPAEDPKKKAQSILDALPGNSLVSKTAILSSAAGLSIYALSNEYYVVNEETVVAFCLLSVWGAVIKYAGPMYSEWAEGQNKKIAGILNAARADHTQAVKSRIDSVQQMSGVVDITKSLFEVSKVNCNPGHFRQACLVCAGFDMSFIGNRQARVRGLRAGAEDRFGR